MNFEKAEKTAKELVAKMTVEEKISQLVYTSPAIERLGINEYNWWNEALHGVARAGIATVFPQAIGMAATFDPALIKKIGDAVSAEARAKYNKSVKFGDRSIYKGLTFWSPNINIFRDPRWGRGQETFGEDPFLSASMGTQYIKGLQGEGEYLRCAACAKHYAGHSGPESERHTFDAKISKKDLAETYLPAFEKAVKAGVIGVMGAYNRTNGQPCCAHTELMEETLYKKWGFRGYFVSDCGAINDIYANHHYTDTLKEAAAVALKRGCDLNCGAAYAALVDAYEEDLVTEEDITRAVEHIYTVRALLGEFEEKRPYSDIGYDVLDCREHKELNLRAACETMVLLKNENGFLPLSKEKTEKIAVIGPNAMSKIALEGNYNGHASEYVTVTDGIRRVFSDCRILAADGAHLYRENKLAWGGFENQVSEGCAAASEADVTVLCLGLDCTVEGEEIRGLDSDFFAAGDKKTLCLPKSQINLAEALCTVCENLIVVVMCGSTVDLTDKIRAHAKAIIHAWYPGALGGLAVAKLLAGEYSPSGRLPLTFVKDGADIPEFTDYSMAGRTYRYAKEEPIYPFGYGLSFTSFRYDGFEVVSSDEDLIKVKVNVTNTGSMDAGERVQIYAHYDDSRTDTPVFQLCAITPVDIAAGDTETVTLDIDRYWIKAVLCDGSRVEPDGKITLYAGGHQPDALSDKLCGYSDLSLEL